MQTGELTPMVSHLILGSLSVGQELRSQFVRFVISFQSSSSLLVVIGGSLTESLLPESQ